MAGWSAQLKEFELYDEKLYVAQIMDTELTEPGQYGRQGCWKLELQDVEREDGEPAFINFYTPIMISGANKYGQLLTACRRPLPEPGVTFPSASLIGEFVQARVIHYLRKKDGQLGCKVSEVLPLTPKQRQAITLSMPGTKAEIEEDTAPAQPAIDFDKINKSNEQAAANAAGEKLKASAIEELRPILMMMTDALKAKDQKLTAENTGPGLKALAKASKAQGVPIPDVDFALVSLTSIGLAKEEALALIETLSDDPFEAE
jgi:hypothetical protein